MFFLSFAAFAITLSALGIYLLHLHAGTRESDLPISVYEDKTDSLNLETIQQLDRQGLFLSRKEFGRKGLGFTQSSVWVKFTQVFEPGEKRYFLGTSRPDYTTMDAYLLDAKGKLLSFEALGTDAKVRKLDTRLPVGRVEFPSPGTYTFFVKIRSSLQLSLSLYLVEENEYLRAASNESNIYFLYFGTIAGLLLYNLCLFFVLKSGDYIFYTVFGLSMLSNAYVQGGFAEVYPIAFLGLASTKDTMHVLFLPCITSLLFTISFLNMRKHSKRLTRVMLGTASLAALFQIILWFDKTSSVRVYASLCDGISVVSVFVGSILAIRAGDKIARIFLLSWGILAFCVGIWILGNLGFLEKTHFVAMAPIAGNMAEMILMSMGLAMRIRDIKTSKMLAEVKAREKEYTQHLLRMVCHDIANPLSVIKSMIHIAQRSEGPDKNFIPRVQKASESIEAIIGQVRRYEAFRSGKITLDLKACSLRKALEDIDFYFGELAVAKGIRLSWTFPQGQSDFQVLADEIALSHEVINNIVSNALKFTNPGGFVNVSAWDEGKWIAILIEDDGIGIPSDLLPRLFEANGSTTRKGTSAEAGSGFGMPLVKHFIDIFNGLILIDSRESGQEGSHDSRAHGTRVIIKLLKA